MVLCLKTRKSRSLPDLVMLSRFLFIASPLTPLGRINQGAFLCITNKRVRSTDKSHTRIPGIIRPNLALPVIRKFIRTQSHIYRLNTPHPKSSPAPAVRPLLRNINGNLPRLLLFWRAYPKTSSPKAAREQSDPSAFPLNVAERAARASLVPLPRRRRRNPVLRNAQKCGLFD